MYRLICILCVLRKPSPAPGVFACLHLNTQRSEQTHMSRPGPYFIQLASPLSHSWTHVRSQAQTDRLRSPENCSSHESRLDTAPATCPTYFGESVSATSEAAMTGGQHSSGCARRPATRARTADQAIVAAMAEARYGIPVFSSPFVNFVV
jgi:hypothetical protein